MAVNESEVKQILRNVSVSSQSTQTPFTLRQSPYQLKGLPVGYNSFIQFLQSIPGLQINGTSEITSIPHLVRTEGSSANSEIRSAVTERSVYIFGSAMKKQKPPEGKLSSVPRNKVIGEVTKRSDQNLRKIMAQKQLSSALHSQLNKRDAYWRSIPENFLRSGEKIEKCPANAFIVGHRIPIIINTISSPGEFWISKENTVYTRMMKLMQNYYGSDTSEYLIPEEFLEEGLFCVVFKSGEFQRGLILDLRREVDGYVRLYLMDSGIEHCTSSGQIWLLDRQFSHLPTQTMKAQLSNIQPVKKVWSKESTKRFVDFVSGKEILAKVSKAEDGNITAYISEDCYPSKILNDILVEEGFATFCN